MAGCSGKTEIAIRRYVEENDAAPAFTPVQIFAEPERHGAETGIARARFTGGRARSPSLVAEARERDQTLTRVIDAGCWTFGFDACGTEIDQVIVLTFVVHDHSPSVRHGHDWRMVRRSQGYSKLI